MKCALRTRPTPGRLLLAASLAFAGLGLISCGDGQGSSQKDSGANTNGGLDGAGRDVLRTDAPTIPDSPVTGPEAGIVDVGPPDQPVPDAAVRLDVQATPDLPAIEAAITEKDAYEAPVSLDAKANLDTSSTEPDLPLPTIPDAAPADAAPDVAADAQPDVGPDMQPDVVDAPPDAPADLPSSDLALTPQGLGGTGGTPECVYWTDCAPTTETCKVATCSGGRCVLVDSMAGASCGANGNACNGRGQCVNHCLDTVKDSDESDVDCGGTCGATCMDTPPQKCRLGGNDCASGVCLESPTGTGGARGSSSLTVPIPGHMPPSGGASGAGGGGAGGGGAGGGGGGGIGGIGGDTGTAFGYCQPASCSDGVKNNIDETDVDCGGRCSSVMNYDDPSRPPLPRMCQVERHCQIDGDCLSNYCAGNEGGGGTCQARPCESTADCRQPFLMCFTQDASTTLYRFLSCQNGHCNQANLDGSSWVGMCPHGLGCSDAGVDCKASCASDSDCAPGNHCDLASGLCSIPLYGPCMVSAPEDCTTGYCVHQPLTIDGTGMCMNAID